MMHIITKYRGTQRGSTLVELMVALLITGIIALATLQFYVKMNNVTETQQHISDAQLLCRNSLMEIKKNLRMAGFKLKNHVPYEISGDSLAIYYSDTKPVDTIIYYLQEFDVYEYSKLPKLPTGRKVWNLMKKVNSDPAEAVADYIIGLRYTVIDSANVAIQLATQTPGRDESFQKGNGYRVISLSERVTIRNVG